jgi:receptor expression-enhancing protein 1/2/3/4
MLWDNVISSATGPQSAPAPESVSGSSAQTPALSASVSGPTQILGTLWRTYGPAIVAGGTALLQQGVTPRDARVSSTRDERPQGYDVGDDPEPIPMPHMQSRTPSSESAGGLRGRVASSTTIGPGGRFEEIEVPSDGEGGRPDGSPTEPTSRPSSGGWFGWISAAPTHAKSD